LRDPELTFEPEDLLDFIELPAFTRRWHLLGLDDEEDLSTLQRSIMANPLIGAAIKGTSAIRKLRFAPSRWKVGKRGATRVLYVYFQEFGIVLLCLVYGKGEVDNIASGVKKYLNKLVEDVDRELRRRVLLKRSSRKPRGGR